LRVETPEDVCGQICGLKQQQKGLSMEDIVRSLLPFALAAVAIVLLLGLRTMLKGDNPGLSQKLMRWRVILQFVAVVIIMAVIYFAGRTP